MRIRIALATAVAVILTPTVLFAFLSSSPSGAVTGHRNSAVSQHRTVARLHLKLTSYDRAVKTDEVQQRQTLATFLTDQAFKNAVEVQQVHAFLAMVAYLNAQAQARQQAAAAQAVAQAATTHAAIPAATSAPPAAASDATSTATADWACIRQHESGGNYGEGGGGAYQFEFGTWNSLTGLPAPAEDYPAATQDAAALRLYAERGFEPWTTRWVCGL